MQDFSALPPVPPAYTGLVSKAADTYGVPQSVLHWVLNRESGYNPTAVGIPTSTGQAQGMAQLMPGTQKMLGVSDPMDPTQAIPAAANLLSQNYAKTGNWTDAVAHYGTFSSGAGSQRDQALRSGFQKMLGDTGTSGAPTAQAAPQGPSLGSLAALMASSSNQGSAAPQMSGSNSYDPSQDPQSAGLPPSLQASPGQSGQLLTSPWSSLGLLRMAQGFAGKKTFGEAISGAAGGLAQGQMDDNQMARLQQQMAIQRAQLGIDSGKLGIEQQQANTEATKAQDQAGYWRGMAVDRMGTLISNGVPPLTAWQMVSSAAAGPGNQAQGQVVSAQQPPPGLASMPTGGRQTKGDLFYAPDGTSFQQMDRMQGPPTFYNLTTNQSVPALPQGSFRAQDSAFRKQNDFDATAENGAIAAATSGRQDNALYQSVLDLAPQVNQGGDIASTLARNFTNFTGGNTANAQSLAGNIMSQLQVARIKALSGNGIGPLKQSEIKAVQAAGVNWQTQPAALQAITRFAMAQNDQKQDLVDKWQAAPDDVRAKGFRRFNNDYMNTTKLPSPTDTSGPSDIPDANGYVDPMATPAAPAASPAVSQGQAGGFKWSIVPPAGQGAQ